MKKIYFFVIFFNFLFSIFNLSSAQSGEWVWLRGQGNNTYNSLGSFGVQGVASINNDPPALYEAAEWTDASGKFWFYGGLDVNAGVEVHNDLWKYDPSNNEWIWVNGTHTYSDPGNYGVQGVASPTNAPPSLGYGVTTWTDLNGNLWMFGGALTQNGPIYADLWEYNITSNEWTWMNGPGTANPTGVYGTQGIPNSANYPAARSECAASWVDAAGDLWIFGGYLSGYYNDLWRYNIASNTWTWMKGSSSLTQKGFWGTMGVESPQNVPSSRKVYGRWTDNSGNFWLFGGAGIDSSGVISEYDLSDLWRYNPGTNNWIWMNGDALGNSSGVFGTKCTTASSNQPAARYENRCAWKDPSGNLWMFSGVYSGFFSTYGLNDLWMYCVTSNEWTWEGGSNTTNSTGNWGTMGIASSTNVPSPRIGNPGWTDGKGHLYTWGGTAANAFGSLYNDLWEFTIDTACYSPCANIVQTVPVPDLTASETSFCSGNCIDYTDLSSNNPTSWLWSFPGATPSSSTDENPIGICYFTSGMYNATLTASNNNGSNSITYSNYINVFAAPSTPTITCAHDTLYCSFDPTYTSYQWYYNDSLVSGGTSSSLMFTQNGNYDVAVMNENGCSIAVGITTEGCTTGIENIFDSHAVTIYPNPATDQLLVTGYPSTAKNTISVFDVLGKAIYKEDINGEQEIINCKSFSSGVYFILISNETGRWVGRFVKE